MLVILLAVVGIAIFANYGPLQSYVDARSRLEKAQAEVAALEEQKAELQSQLGKLTEAEYLEGLAREALTYAKPGEEVYIISGLGEDSEEDSGSEEDSEGDGTLSAEPSDAEVESSGVEEGNGAGEESGVGEEADSQGDKAGSGTDEPGFFEKVLSGFLDIF